MEPLILFDSELMEQSGHKKEILLRALQWQKFLKKYFYLQGLGWEPISIITKPPICLTNIIEHLLEHRLSTADTMVNKTDILLPSWKSQSGGGDQHNRCAVITLETCSKGKRRVLSKYAAKVSHAAMNHSLFSHEKAKVGHGEHMWVKMTKRKCAMVVPYLYAPPRVY